MPDLQMFIPITKIDAAKRLVYGVATAEQKDRAGEICDYASTKPFYEKWSGEVSKASDGKSLGNIRAMHGKIAAGKVTEISFNDAAMQIEICAKVVDDAEWAKVEEGVYTGFSQGGSYVKRWKDADGLQRYTADPAEVSLVDMPCLPSATFQFIKADGLTEERHFTSVEKDTPVITNDQVAAKARELAKVAGDETKWADHVEPARVELEKAASGETIEPAKVVEAEKPSPTVDVLNEVEQVWKSKDGQTFKNKADAVKHAADLAKVETPADKAITALSSALGKVDLSTDGRKAEAKTGTAMKDGSYPIDDKKSLKDAVDAFGRAKNKAATKRHIVQRAKALKLTDLLPADWPGSTQKADKAFAVTDLDKAAEWPVEQATAVRKFFGLAADLALTKDVVAKAASLYGVANMVQLLAALEDAEESFEMDSYWGGTVNVPADLKTRFGALLGEFGDLVAETLDLVLQSSSDEEIAEEMTRGAQIRDLIKAGARHSKTDTDLIQKAHDATVALGADCDADNAEKHQPTGDLAKADLAKLTAENAEFKATLEKMMPLMTEAAEKISTLEAQVKKISETPMPGGPARLNVIGKEDEVTTNIRKAAEAGDGEAVALELFKLSHGRPLRGLPGIMTPQPTTVQTASEATPAA